MINKVILVGNLGRDPELRYTQSGVAVCRLSIATTRKWKTQSGEKQEETEWHRVVVWNKQAEHCNTYLKKGRTVYIEGRLKTTSYVKDDETRYSTDVVADTVQFIGKGEGQGQPLSNSSQQHRQQQQNNNTGGYNGGPEGDDIPF